MANEQTTMKDLLIGVRYLLEQERTSTGQLKSVRQLKRGVLPIRPIFPCVALIPSYETIIAYRSSRMVIVEREIQVNILTLDASGKKGITLGQDIAEACLDVLRDDIHVTDSSGATNAISVTFGNMDYNEHKPIDGAGLYNVVLPCRYVSKGSMASVVNMYQGLQGDNAKSSTMVDAIRDQLSSKRSTTLKSILKFETEHWGPNATFPRVLVSVVREDQVQEKRGIDVVHGEYSITIESLIGSARDTSMDFHLGLIEPIKDALEEEVFWSGKCNGSEIGSISFDAVRAQGKPVYQTSLAYHVTLNHSRV